MAGPQYQPPRTPTTIKGLTMAEGRLLGMLTTRLTLRQIASHLGLRYYTIRSQKQALYRRLGVMNRGQAVWEGVLCGALPVPQV